MSIYKERKTWKRRETVGKHTHTHHALSPALTHPPAGSSGAPSSPPAQATERKRVGAQAIRTQSSRGSAPQRGTGLSPRPRLSAPWRLPGASEAPRTKPAELGFGVGMEGRSQEPRPHQHAGATPNLPARKVFPASARSCQSAHLSRTRLGSACMQGASFPGSREGSTS